MRLLETKFLKFINESSFYDLDFDDLSIDNIYNEIDIDYIDTYRNYFSIDDEIDDDEILNDEKYKNFIINDLLKHNYNDFERSINMEMNLDGTITLFRIITIDDKDKWLQHLKINNGGRLGIYWSWYENAAEAHWGKSSHKSKALMSIIIDEKYVNWKETARLNIHPNYMEEKEIRLFKNTPIRLESLIIDNEEIDLEEYGLDNKTFKA